MVEDIIMDCRQVLKGYIRVMTFWNAINEG